MLLAIIDISSQFIPEDTLFEVLLYAVTIPIGSSTVLLAQHMALEGCLTIPQECLVVVTFYAIAKVIGVGHVYLRLHQTPRLFIALVSP